MKTVIIQYNAGNIQSVLFALERIGVEAIVSDDEEQIQHADKVIFPGVGEASTAMQYLKHRKLDQLILQLKQPVLGICLGMQLMCKFSEENNTQCLGIFDEQVAKFNPGEEQLKIPQIGWNNIYDLQSGLFMDILPPMACILLLQQIMASRIVRHCTRIIFMEYNFIQKKVLRWGNKF